jgi:hypothetical protein
MLSPSSPIAIPHSSSSSSVSPANVSMLHEFAGRNALRIVDRPVSFGDAGFNHTVVCAGVCGSAAHDTSPKLAKMLAYFDWWSQYQRRLTGLRGAITIPVSILQRYPAVEIAEILTSLGLDESDRFYRTHLRVDLLNAMLGTAIDGYAEALAEHANKIMHARNGNSSSSSAGPSPATDVFEKDHPFLRILDALQDECYEVYGLVLNWSFSSDPTIVDGAAEAAAEAHNSEMHALNGNNPRRSGKRAPVPRELRKPVVRATKVTGNPKPNQLRRKARIMGNRRLSAAAKNWMIATLDPFHDKSFDAPRCPDGQAFRGLGMTETMSATIVSPPGAPATWELWVFACPYTYGSSAAYSVTPTHDGSNPNNYFNSLISFLVSTGSNGVATATIGYDAGTGFWPVGEGRFMPAGGVSYITCPTAAAFQAFDPATMAYGALQVPSNFLFGSHRILGGGFELENTTAPLYKQGTCTVARVPCTKIFEPIQNTITYRHNDGTTSVSDFPGQVTLQQFPSSLTDLVEMQNSCQWPAERGAYVVQHMRKVPDVAGPRRVLLRTPVSGQTGVAFSGPSPVWSSAGGTIAYVGTTDNSAATGLNQVPMCVPYTDIDADWSVCCMSGLSPQTTFTLRARMFIERFPTSITGTTAYNEDAFVSQARHSPPREDYAIALWEAAMAKLPSGCPYDENPLGEWFDTVVDIIDAAAPAIGGAFGPKGAAIGQAVASAARLAGQANARARAAESKANAALNKKK